MNIAAVIRRRRRFAGEAVLRAVISGLTSGTALHNVELTASLDGASTWQWQQSTGGSWTNISGATSATFTPVIGTNVTDEAQLRAVPDGDAGLASPSYTIRHAAPVQNAVPIATGDPVIGESLSGTAGTFTGEGLTIASEWEVSDDGSAGWTGTADIDLTGPAMVAGKHYRLATTASNSGGSLTTRSNVIGPAVAPVLTLNGLTDDAAIVGDEDSISVSVDQGTITARRWGSTSGGDEFGTSTNPTDYTDAVGGTLYGGVQVGGVWYEVTAPVVYPQPEYIGGAPPITVTINVAMTPVDMAQYFIGIGLTFEAAGLPTGLEISSAGSISGTATSLGTEEVLIIATDVNSDTAQAIIDVTVQPAAAPAYIGGLEALTVTVDVAMDSYPTAAFFTGADLSFDATGLPAGTSIDSETGIITGTPTAVSTQEVEVTATNTGGDASGSFTYVVEAESGPPLWLGTPENRTYDVGSGTRFYNMKAAGYLNNLEAIDLFMVPRVMAVTILTDGEGTYGRRALTAGAPNPTYGTVWELDGTPIDGQTGATIDAEALELTGDLTAVVTATNTYGEHSLESAATAVDFEPPSVTNPSHLGSIASGTASTVTSFAATNPAYSAGDLVIVSHTIDHGSNVTILEPTPPDAETVFAATAQITNGTGTGGTSTRVYRYVAAANRAEGANITVNTSAGEQHAVTVTVIDAGTFDPTTPMGDIVPANDLAGGATASAPGTTATNAGGMVMVFLGTDAATVGTAPAGYSTLAQHSSGAAQNATGRRTAFTTASESIAGSTWPLSPSDGWVAITAVVNGAPA